MSSNNICGRVEVIDARTWYQLTSLQGVVTPLTAGVAAYNALLAELSPRHLPVSVLQFVSVLRQQHELIAFLFHRSTLLGTAQASLLFPGCWPTVHIEKVVVTASYRGQGLGEHFMRELEKLILQRFGGAGSLTVTLTSRAERGTQPFYERLGYQSDMTNRFTKKLPTSAP